MKIAVIVATSQTEKNQLIYESVKKYAVGHEILNFGCFTNEENYSYIEISILIGLLLSSKSVDFVVTGCSSGQGMALACNSIPGVICGYAPEPMDAYLFAQINNGNAISLPLGEEYTYKGEENLKETIQKLFSEEFGKGYPEKEAERKIKDSNTLKEIRKCGQKNFKDFINQIDPEIIEKILKKKDVMEYIKYNYQFVMEI